MRSPLFGETQRILARTAVAERRRLPVRRGRVLMRAHTNFCASRSSTMSRASLSLAVLSCAALLVMRPSAAAQGRHADTAKPFNGSSLAGWHPQGAAQWRAASGEIVGTSTGTPGWLVLDKSY